jgi:SAM-dependent methyltransferase
MKIHQDIPSKPWKGSYVTYRRLWLDAAMTRFAQEMRGVVIDLGGKRSDKRGTFHPPEHQADMWLYINLDLQTRPNLFADVTQTPLKAQIADSIICTEVLEHLSNPQACVDETHRLLRNGGLVFASTPFFYPVHADPYDFQRFTEDGLRHLFRDFKSIEVYRMGGYAGVLGLIVELGIFGMDGNSYFDKLMRWLMKWASRLLFCYDLRLFGRESVAWQKFTTGYFVKAVK